jgi:hypothetical protein
MYVCIYDHMVHLMTHIPFYRSPTGTFENCEMSMPESSQIADFCLRLQYLCPIDTLGTVGFCSIPSLSEEFLFQIWRPSSSRSKQQHPNHPESTISASVYVTMASSGIGMSLLSCSFAASVTDL